MYTCTVQSGKHSYQIIDLHTTVIILARHVSTRLDTCDVASESRRACRAVMFQHGGRRRSYSARLYKFSRFYAPTYTNPIHSV